VAAPPRECRAVVAATRALTPDVLEADLDMIDPPTLTFAAGQWISVPFGPKTVRAYSIASTPGMPSRLTLSADVAPGGPGSRWFRGLAPGATVTFKGPLGGFVFDRTDPRHPLFVAEEIGIVPIRSMLLDLAETGWAGAATLVYWARDAGWLVYDADFRALAARDARARFSYRPVIGASLADAVASVADEILATRGGPGFTPGPERGGLGGRPEPPMCYVAGGAATIAAAREALMARGLDRKSVKWEKFYG
jgi:ferredoxin-NADP reductase